MSTRPSARHSPHCFSCCSRWWVRGVHGVGVMCTWCRCDVYMVWVWCVGEGECAGLSGVWCIVVWFLGVSMFVHTYSVRMLECSCDLGVQETFVWVLLCRVTVASSSCRLGFVYICFLESNAFKCTWCPSLWSAWKRAWKHVHKCYFIQLHTSTYCYMIRVPLGCLSLSPPSSGWGELCRQAGCHSRTDE